MTMLGIDAILAAHGIGGQPGPYFGNGSDGAFNPAAPAPVLVNSNITFGINGGYYEGSNMTSQPTLLQTSTTVPCFGLVCDEGTTNNGQTVSQYDVKPGYTATSTSYNFAQIGVMFSSSQAINVKGVWVATSGFGSNYTVQINLWDTTTQTLIAQSAVITTGLNAGWNQINFPSSVSLVAGRNYMIGIGISGASNVYPGYYYNPVNPTVNATYTYNSQGTYTFSTTQDGAAVVKQFTSVNIPQNLTVNVANRCQGMVWLVEGDVNISGIVSMDYMGALLDPTQNAGFAVATKVQQLYCPIGNNKFVIIGPGGAGGAGGKGGAYSINGDEGGRGGLPSGGTWWGGGRGGGGGGGCAGGTKGGNGGDGTFGTSAGGASGSGTPAHAGNPGNAGGGGGGAWLNATSGAGGKGLGGGGGGGGGAQYTGTGAGGAAGNGADSTQAPGGLILIICGGNFTINSGAVLTAKGGAGGGGGNGYTGSSSYVADSAGGGGGGAGGGIIALLYRGTFTNSGTTNVAGGSAGTHGANGTGQIDPGSSGYNGLPGVVQTVKIA